MSLIVYLNLAKKFMKICLKENNIMNPQYMLDSCRMLIVEGPLDTYKCFNSFYVILSLMEICFIGNHIPYLHLYVLYQIVCKVKLDGQQESVVVLDTGPKLSAACPLFLYHLLCNFTISKQQSTIFICFILCAWNICHWILRNQHSIKKFQLNKIRYNPVHLKSTFCYNELQLIFKMQTQYFGTPNVW